MGSPSTDLLDKDPIQLSGLLCLVFTRLSGENAASARCCPAGAPEHSPSPRSHVKAPERPGVGDTHAWHRLIPLTRACSEVSIM